MSELPAFKPLRFPPYLTAEDAPIHIPVERLTDEQAHQFWMSQAKFFVEYVRARRNAVKP